MRSALSRYVSILAPVGLLVGGFFACTPSDTTVATANPSKNLLKTEYVVLVTADGLRHQELFHGADPTLLDPANVEKSGVKKNLDKLRERFSRETDSERRTALMPFFWGELAKQGIVIGDVAAGSKVTVRNPQWFSYPGYAEILTGAPQPEIDANSKRPIPTATSLEIVHRELSLDFHQVATFASWEVIEPASMTAPGKFFVNAGYSHMPDELLDDSARTIDRAQDAVKTAWDDVRHDGLTFPLALHYLRTKKPRLMYISFAETDDWAHARRYDRVLQSVHYFDQALGELWTALQSMDKYRNRTTLIVTTDHGRGRTLEDWHSHKAAIPGSNEIWIAVIGPDTPDRGALANTGGHSQSQVAGTLLKFFGLDRNLLGPDAGQPIAEAFSAGQ